MEIRKEMVREMEMKVGEAGGDGGMRWRCGEIGRGRWSWGGIRR